jgi:hypothetical protein
MVTFPIVTRGHPGRYGCEVSASSVVQWRRNLLSGRGIDRFRWSYANSAAPALSQASDFAWERAARRSPSGCYGGTTASPPVVRRRAWQRATGGRMSTRRCPFAMADNPFYVKWRQRGRIKTRKSRQNRLKRPAHHSKSGNIMSQPARILRSLGRAYRQFSCRRVAPAAVHQNSRFSPFWAATR